MTSRLDQHRTALALAIRQLETDLEHEPAWANFIAAEANGAPGPADSARHDGLAGNPLFQVRARLLDALAIIDTALAAPKPSGLAALTPLAPWPRRTAAAELTRIRGIDDTMAMQLLLVGVQSLSEIAHWRAADVTRLTAALQLGRRINKENWIEQAALLLSKEPAPAVSATAEAPPPASTPAPTSVSQPEPNLDTPPSATVDRLASPVCFLPDLASHIPTEATAADEPSDPPAAEPALSGQPVPSEIGVMLPEAPEPATETTHRETLQERLERLDRLAETSLAADGPSASEPSDDTPPPVPAGEAADPGLARFLERRRAAKTRRSGLAALRDGYDRSASPPPKPDSEADVAIVSPARRSFVAIPPSPIAIVEPLDPGGPVRDGPLSELPVQDPTGRNLAFAEEASVEIVRRRPADKPKYDWLTGTRPDEQKPPVAGRFLKALKGD